MMTENPIPLAPADRILALRPEALPVIREALRLHAAGIRLERGEWAARLGVGAARPSVSSRGGIAVLPVLGLLSARPTLLAEIFGGSSTMLLAADLRRLAADPGIEAVILDIDSPGGSVFGVEELAATVAEVATRKRVVAIANAMAASAAYWVAAAAGEVVITPSGEVGSIGIIGVHEDISKLEERLGIKTTLIGAGRFKTEGSSFEPLGAEARAALQARVDDYYTLFVNRVARGRGVPASRVREGFGQGRMLGARAARAEGLVDRIEPFEATLGRVSREPGRLAVRAGVPGPDLDWYRRRQRLVELDAPASAPSSRDLDRQVHVARLQRAELDGGDVAARRARLARIRTEIGTR